MQSCFNLGEDPDKASHQQWNRLQLTKDLGSLIRLLLSQTSINRWGLIYFLIYSEYSEYSLLIRPALPCRVVFFSGCDPFTARSVVFWNRVLC